MATMIVTYRHPADPEHFLDHYYNRHVPLARQLPGLLEYAVGTGDVTSPGGGETPFLVGVLRFESMTALREAFASEVGRACAEDRRILAPGKGDSAMILFDEKLVFPL
jgi:uncharacterized protein (TIGR02118 family)